MNINYKLIGLRISQIRKELDMTQEELAAAADVSAQYISLVETGKRSVSFKVIVEIAQALSVTLDELVYGTYSASGTDEWAMLFSDSTRYEREILTETAAALKKALRLYRQIR